MSKNNFKLQPLLSGTNQMITKTYQFWKRLDSAYLIDDKDSREINVSNAIRSLQAASYALETAYSDLCGINEDLNPGKFNY